MNSTPSVRVRFAPSPTGNPHVGNFRTALYNYLFARNQGGAFLLRIEDTDKERSKKEYEDAILKSLAWLGLDLDEEPVFQSRNVERHQAEVMRLVEEGHAYRCVCKPERINTLREEQQKRGETPRYDGHCREANHPADGEPFCVRLKTPRTGAVHVNDAVRGEIVKQHDELDDLVLLRTDGAPTYNLAVVVDDFDMKITHVMRGDDHINNTLRQVVIGKLLGYPVPGFIHLPQILGPDKTRLSKRHGAAGVLEYREQGFLPEALNNYLARLGWGHGDQEIFSPQQLIEFFALDGLNKSAAVFDPKKLLWVNAEHIRGLSDNEFANRFKAHAVRKGYLTEEFCSDAANESFFSQLGAAVQERSQTLDEAWEQISFVFNDIVAYPEKEAGKIFKAEAVPGLADLADYATQRADDAPSLEEWEAKFKEILEAREIKMKTLAQPVRLALTGTLSSPPIYNILTLLGPKACEKRLRRAVDFIQSNAEAG